MATPVSEASWKRKRARVCEAGRASALALTFFALFCSSWQPTTIASTQPKLALNSRHLGSATALSGVIVAKQHGAPTLILRARVRAVVIDLTDRRYRFRVEVDVLAVQRGRYGKKQFQFRIHSRSRSNLRAGQLITIEAWRTAGRYDVDRNKRY